MDVADWVAAHDAMHDVCVDDGRRYVAVVYDDGADLVPGPVFDAMAADAVDGADDHRSVDSYTLQQRAAAYDRGDAVDRWVAAGVVPAPRVPGPRWDRLQRYAGWHDPGHHRD